MLRRPRRPAILRGRDSITQRCRDGAGSWMCRFFTQILFGQHVGTEDVILGMSDKTPSSIHADRMVVRILLKGERMADI